MIIRELSLYVQDLGSQKKFYRDILGFDLIHPDSNQFSIILQCSKLSFIKSGKNFSYHYCFLIPSNQRDESIEWLKTRLSLIEMEPGRVIQNFDTWNADSVYFYDGAGNLAEFIVRYDLKNESQTPFSIENIICVNEIGMPTTNIRSLNTKLEETLGTRFWKGDLKRFGTNGDQMGLFLLPNYEIKRIWFPTDLRIEQADFFGLIENKGNLFQLEFNTGKLHIIPNSR